MILADTNVWIEHLRGTHRACALEDLLKKEQVLFHPWVFGELILGNLGPKKQEISLYFSLLQTTVERPVHEVVKFVERESLSGKGLSLIDAQLLYGSVKDGYLLWTFDKALRKAAERFDRAAP
jgi:predicted nucleic acid-binding protein